MSHSNLPPLLDGGTVLAVVGACTVEDVKTHNRNDEDMRSSATSVTHTSLSLMSSHATESLSEFFHFCCFSWITTMRRKLEYKCCGCDVTWIESGSSISKA
jgi:hypothetical protein